MTTNPAVLDMLGDDLKVAVVGAQGRTGDDTIMARIDEGLCLVERDAEVLVSGLSIDAAVAYLDDLV